MESRAIAISPGSFREYQLWLKRIGLDKIKLSSIAKNSVEQSYIPCRTDEIQGSYCHESGSTGDNSLG